MNHSGLKLVFFLLSGLLICPCVSAQRDTLKLEFQFLFPEIKHVFAHNNGFAGINLSGTTFYSKTDFDNENIYIGFCKADNNPGDPTITDNHSGNGTHVGATRHCIIEYCEASNNGWDMPWTGNGPVGIWAWDPYAPKEWI